MKMWIRARGFGLVPLITPEPLEEAMGSRRSSSRVYMRSNFVPKLELGHTNILRC